MQSWWWLVVVLGRTALGSNPIHPLVAVRQDGNRRALGPWPPKTGHGRAGQGRCRWYGQLHTARQLCCGRLHRSPLRIRSHSRRWGYRCIAASRRFKQIDSRETVQEGTGRTCRSGAGTMYACRMHAAWAPSSQTVDSWQSAPPASHNACCSCAHNVDRPSGWPTFDGRPR